VVLTRLFLLISFFSVACAEIHEIGSYERTETIDGAQFKCKLFFDDKEIIKDFFVDDAMVDQETFQKMKFDAHERELRVAQQQLKVLYDNDTVQFNCVRSRAYVKLIKQIRDSLQAIINKIYEEQLQPFWAFQELTIGSKEMLQRINLQLLPALSFSDEAGAENESVQILGKFLERLEQLYTIVSQFYHDTVNAALERSDDPKDLKKLLELT